MGAIETSSFIPLKLYLLAIESYQYSEKATRLQTDRKIRQENGLAAGKVIRNSPKTIDRFNWALLCFQRKKDLPIKAILWQRIKKSTSKWADIH